jgi:hypothetical protein
MIAVEASCKVQAQQGVWILDLAHNMMDLSPMAMDLVIKRLFQACIAAMDGQRTGVGLFASGQMQEENCLTAIYSLLVELVVARIQKVCNAFLYKFCSKDVRYFRLAPLLTLVV